MFGVDSDLYVRVCESDLYVRVCESDLYVRVCESDLYVRVCESDLYVRVCVGIVSPLTFQSGRNFSNFLSLPPAENT